MGRLHAIITMHQPPLGEGKRAVLLAMGQVNLLKLVIVVDDDIDPEDWRQVEWSLAARFRGHEDLIVLPGVKADRCDPRPRGSDRHQDRHDRHHPSRATEQPAADPSPPGRRPMCWRACAASSISIDLEHDPEKWVPVFGKDHAQQSSRAG